MSTKAKSVFKYHEAMSTIHDKYVVVPIDKALNNIVLICKSQKIDCLKIELDLDISQGDPTYTATTLSLIITVLSSFSLVIFSYCIRYQNHTSLHRNKVISQKLQSVLPTIFLKFSSIFTAAKTSPQKYHDTSLFRCGVKKMWILKSSKQLPATLSYRSQYVYYTFDFSTLYTNIQHTRLWLKNWFSVKEEQRRTKVSVAGYL
jgi:hypothetical protein